MAQGGIDADASPDPDSGAASIEEATLDGDVPFSPAELRSKPGTARSALRVRDLRRLWVATFSSNIGTWMQNVALGAFAYRLSHSANFVALIGFAQLGPLLVFAPVGGLLADLVDRRRLLVLTNFEQLVFSGLLAWVATLAHPSRALIVVVVFAVGIGNALTGPVMASLLPNLVPREDLAGAISLQGVQINLSRVLGPAIGGLLLPVIHAKGVFAINAVTYLFAVAGALSIRPVPQTGRAESAGIKRLLGGVAVARREPLVRSVLMTIATISFFVLPFVGLMPVIAAQHLGLNVNGFRYGLLYAIFGLGATSGAVLVGTVLVGRRRDVVVSVALSLFGASLLVFALLHDPDPAYPMVFIAGTSYLAAVTSLSTRLQESLHDAVRGRVMALYTMAFGGTVPLGLLAAGAISGVTSITTVVVGGAVIALVLAVIVRPGSRRGRLLAGVPV